MNKTELIAAVAEQAELSKKDAEKALKAFTDVIAAELVKGEKVQLVGFGTFEVSEREAREGRNPLTGEKITSETEHIKQSIADILLTPIGSRLQRRDYGSRIPELIDRPMNHALLLQLAASAVMALHKWEPRVTISQFKPQLTENGITCSIVGRTRNQNNVINYDDVWLGGKNERIS